MIQESENKMLRIENEIASIHLKKKKEEVAKLQRTIGSYQKISTFWLNMYTKLLLKVIKSGKICLVRAWGSPETIQSGQVEKILNKADSKEFKSMVLCFEEDQLVLIDALNAKKPVYKVKYKAILGTSWRKALSYMM